MQVKLNSVNRKVQLNFVKCHSDFAKNVLREAVFDRPGKK